MSDLISGGLLAGGMAGFMVSGLAAMTLLPGAQVAMAISFLAMFGACFFQEFSAR